MTEAVALHARTIRVDEELDPFAVAGGDGVLWLREREWMAARGVALVVPAGDPAAVTATLAAIGGGPEARVRAFGVLPFLDARSAGALVVPRVLVGRDADGSRWATVVDTRPPGAGAGAGIDLDAARAAVTEAPAGGAGSSQPSSFRIEPARPPREWCDAVAAATAAIRAGAAVKVVLARDVVVTADAPFDVAEVARRLRAAYPSCTTFSCDGALGASPELLVSRHGDIVRSHPLAGTAARSSDPSTDARLAAALLASEKDRWEHQITIDRVHETLLPYCSYLDSEAEPSIVAVANVQHLGTLVEGRLSSPAPSVLELALQLHPTPAVCGEPRAAALDLIEKLEGVDRGRYAGAAGWVDANGDGEWVVGIRMAEIDGATARVFAGNGIVADSDPDTELAETRAKLQAVLAALVRP